MVTVQYIEETFKKIINDSDLSAFHTSIRAYSEINNILEKFLSKPNIYINEAALQNDNCVYYHSKDNIITPIYLSDHGWNEIYNTLTNLENKINNEDYAKLVNRITLKEINNKQEKIEKNNLIITLVNIIKIIKRSSKNTPYLSLYKEFFSHNLTVEGVKSFISTQMILAFQRNPEGYLKRTIFSFNLAEFLCKCTINSFPELKKLETFFDQKNPIVIIHDNEKKELVSIIKHILISLKDDIKEFELFCEKKLNIKSKLFITLITHYFQNLILNQYKKNKKLIPFQEVIDLLDSLINPTIINQVNKNYRSQFISAGSYFIDFLVKNNIFESKQITENDNRIYVLQATPNILDQLTQSLSGYKPYLSESNIEYLKEIKNHNAVYYYIHENISNKIHSKSYINIEFNNDCYLNDYTHYIKFGIDKNALIIHLNLLTENKKLTASPFILELYKINPNYIDNIKNILEKYEIDLKKLLQVPLQETLYQVFVRELTTFKNSSFLELKKLILKNPNNSSRRTYILTEISRLSQQKLSVIGLYSSSILYARFRYFILPTFIDGRSRVYHHEAFMNIQNFHLAKSVVKLYNGTLKLNTKILLLIKDKLQHVATKQQISKLCEENSTEEDFKKTDTNFIYNGIIKYFKPDLEFTINSFKEKFIIPSKYAIEPLLLLTELIPLMKKQGTALIVHSLIMYEHLRFHNQHDSYLANHYEIDANGSGLHCMSILFRSTFLGIASNLIGTDNKDLYKMLTMEMNIIRRKLSSIATTIQQHFSTEINFHSLYEVKNINTIALTKSNYSKLNNFAERFKMFVDLNISQSLSIYIQDLMRDLIKDFDSYNIDSEKDIDELLFLLEKYHKEILKKCSLFKKEQLNKVKRICIFDIALRYLFLENNYKFFSLENPLWAERELTKIMGMTSYYGSTSYGRQEQILEKILEYYKHSKYIHENPIPPYNFGDMTHLLDKCFLHAMRQTQDSLLMEDFVNALVDLKEPIVVQNKFFKITFNPKKTIKGQTSGSTYFGIRGLQLVYQSEIEESDFNKLKTTSKANIIHVMDSAIVHHLTLLIRNINQSLKREGYDFQLQHSETHDTFFLSVASLTKIFVHEAYLELNKENYINYFPESVHRFAKDTVENYTKLLENINPLFMK